MPKNPNPQGKGLAPILQGLHSALPRAAAPPKHVQQITNELFTSLFVLRSEFKFKPVVGKSYWLYKVDDGFRLYLVGPQEWNSKQPGQLIGECILQADITWTLNLDKRAANDTEFVDLLKHSRDELEQQLQSSKSIEDALPSYEEKMSFYGRLLAYGLGHSLQVSMLRGGIKGLSYREALASLPSTPPPTSDR